MDLCLQNSDFSWVSHIGFALLGLSYMTSDLLVFRVCIAVSNVTLVTWALLALPPASCVSAASWNTLFCLINIRRAVQEWRRRLQMDSVKDTSTRSDSISDSATPSADALVFTSVCVRFRVNVLTLTVLTLTAGCSRACRGCWPSAAAA